MGGWGQCTVRLFSRFFFRFLRRFLCCFFFMLYYTFLVNWFRARVIYGFRFLHCSFFHSFFIHCFYPLFLFTVLATVFSLGFTFFFLSSRPLHALFRRYKCIRLSLFFHYQLMASKSSADMNKNCNKSDQCKVSN